MREREKDERQRPWIPDRVGDDRRRGRTGMTEEKKQILHFVQDDRKRTGTQACPYGKGGEGWGRGNKTKGNDPGSPIGSGMTEGKGGNCQRMSAVLFVDGDRTVSGAFGRTGAIVPTW